MMQLKTPEAVALGMEHYDIRRGNNPLPRYRVSLGANPIYCFDKGHLRALSRADLAPPRAVGNYTVIEGRQIELLPNADPFLGARLPVGFAAVPVQFILQHFTSRYSRNINKIENAIHNHRRNMDVYGREIAKNSNFGRPRRPSLKSLNLDMPTEFEQFLQPLKSYYCLRLRMAFDRLLRDAEDGVNYNNLYNNLDVLRLPDINAGVSLDQALVNRWNASNGSFIAVRLDNVGFTFDPTPGGPVLPPPGRARPAPGPPGGGGGGGGGGGVAAAPLSRIQIDENMLELCQMGRNTKWKGVFIYMEPWQDAIRVSNPFVSFEYKLAFATAQAEFVRRHREFKAVMDAKRARNAQQWKQYRAYRNEMRSSSMLDTNRQPVNQDYAAVERPQVEHFTQEWRHFAFMLKEEMKNFRFLPITAAATAGPVAPGAPAFSFTNGPIRQPYIDISQTVLRSTHRMFLI